MRDVVTAPEPTATGHREHYVLLDGLRGLAAVAVLIYHTKYFTGLKPMPGSYLAVDFFFMLSGFVLAAAYLADIRQGLSFRTFWLKRLIRLWPTYALGLLIGFAWAVHIALQEHQGAPTLLKLSLKALANALYIPAPSHADPQLFPFDGAAWSLFYELVANLAFFILAARFRNGPLVIVSAISFAVLLGWAASGRPIDAGSHGLKSLLALARVGFSFFVGVLIWDRAFRLRSPPAVPGGMALLLCGALLATFGIPLSSALEPWRDILCIALVFPAVVYVAARARVPVSTLPLVRFSAELSYPLYVIHLPSLLVLSALLVKAGLDPHVHPAVYAAAAAILIPAAFAWGVAIDAPARAWLKRRALPNHAAERIGTASSAP